MAKRQKIDPEKMAKLITRTEPDQPQPEQPEDPVKAIGIGLKESEWQRLESIAGELGETRHAVAAYTLRDFIKRFDPGEIRTETKRTLPGL